MFNDLLDFPNFTFKDGQKFSKKSETIGKTYIFRMLEITLSIYLKIL